jgi:hypothetical protein
MSSKVFGFGSVFVCTALFTASVSRADIGFEFESNKNTLAFQFTGQPLSQAQLSANCQNAMLNNANAPYKKPIVEGDYFTAEADELTGGYADLEIVVHGASMTGFPFDDDSRTALDQTLKQISSIYRVMRDASDTAVTAQRPSACMLATTLSPNNGVNNKFIVVTAPASFRTTKVVVQATLGIRLDRLNRFMLDIGEKLPNEGAVDFNNRADGKNFLLPDENRTSFGTYSVGAAADAANTAVDAFVNANPNAFAPNDRSATAALRGMVSITTLYLRGTDNIRAGLAKNSTPILARTDFAKMFSLLPRPQRNYFVANKAQWVALVLNAAGMNGKGTQPLFANLNNLRQLTTKEAWLRGMVGTQSIGGSYKLGTDLLTAKNSGQPELETMGSLGNKTDSVLGDPLVRESPIFELRALKGVTPERLTGFALDLFDYAKNLESGNRTRFAPRLYNGLIAW